MSLALVLLFTCAIETWLVQGKTLLAPQAQAGVDPLLDQAFRLGFNLLGFTALLGFLPRPAVAGVFVGNLAFYLVILFYLERFRQPISLRAILAKPGAPVLPPGTTTALLRPWHLVFLGSLGLKLLLLDGLPDSAFPLTTGVLGLLGYALLLFIVNRRYLPLREIAGWQTVGGLGAVYGYLPAWAAEFIFLPREDGSMREPTPSTAPSDELTPIETPAPIANCLVFLQVERLDWAIIDFTIRQQEVTPNLNRLVRRGMSYAVRPEGFSRSSEADILMLTGNLPSAQGAQQESDDSLVARMTTMGFGTTAIHGASGEMYGRRRALARLGFERVIFREEFQDMGPAPMTGWSVPDDDLLQFAAMDFSACAGRQFHLVMTGTSVPPFPNYDPALARFFPGSSRVSERYFDVIHYVDWAIGRFLNALPAETTVVLYGSQPSGVELGAIGYYEARRDTVGLIPFMVLETGRDLSALQRTGALARTGRFTLQDTARWIHASLELQQRGDSELSNPG